MYDNSVKREQIGNDCAQLTTSPAHEAQPFQLKVARHMILDCPCFLCIAFPRRFIAFPHLFMVFPRIVHGLSIVCPWFVHGHVIFQSMHVFEARDHADSQYLELAAEQCSLNLCSDLCQKLRKFCIQGWQ